MVLTYARPLAQKPAKKVAVRGSDGRLSKSDRPDAVVLKEPGSVRTGADMRNAFTAVIVMKHGGDVDRRLGDALTRSKSRELRVKGFTAKGKR